jgi:ParB family chromosome partitioning protein
VREHGIINPLIVRKINGHHEIVGGGRRFLVAQTLGLKSVPVTIRVLNDTQPREISNLDNLQREGVHPMEEALGYRDLLEHAGYDTIKLAPASASRSTTSASGWYCAT